MYIPFPMDIAYIKLCNIANKDKINIKNDFNGWKGVTMRYYRYGNDVQQKELEAKEKERQDIIGRFGELVIDEDTIYEIDEECLRCREREKK